MSKDFKVKLDHIEWDKGYIAGYSGGSNVAPAECTDEHSYFSGFISGKDAKAAGKPPEVKID